MIERIANTIRGLSADAVQKANSGHPGMPLGAAEMAAVLFAEAIKHNPQDPNWPDRDRFVLSAGHGSALLYSILHLTGYDLSLEDLKQFRQLGSRTPGHPEYGHTPGVETTTGPLGQGLANAVGMALAERMLAERFNTEEHEIVDHYTYVIAGDGCMMEGVTAEASSLAGHLKLGKLIVFYDDNDISIEGDTDIAFTESVCQRYEAYGWQVLQIDGHDPDQIRKALQEAKADKERPSLIVARTQIAKGAPNMEGSHKAHGAPLGEDEVRALKEALGLPPSESFYVPDDVRRFFQQKQAEWRAQQESWQETFAAWSEKNPEFRKLWDQAMTGELPANLEDKLPKFAPGDKIATRSAGGKVLQAIAAEVPYLVGGAADLAPSTKTYLEDGGDVGPKSYKGRNIRFGVREHAMGAICNGMHLHGGLRPFCSTFLVFADYMRPAVRMAALMKLPVIFVFTHDSIWVGEDGPTHQPVEHAESLRIIPNLRVFRPADAEETKYAWLEALRRQDGPTALLLTRQNLPVLQRSTHATATSRGGYIVKDAENPDLILIGCGSEVSLAMEAASALEESGRRVRVVSMPSRQLFLAQEKAYRDEVLPEEGPPRLAVEAGVGSGWYQLLRPGDGLITLDEFGHSGPGAEVAACFGFTLENVSCKAEQLLK